MCFVIDNNAVAPKQKRAWKVVELRGAYVRSAINRYSWHTGEHRIREDAVTLRGPLMRYDDRRGLIRDAYRAREGYYVYLKKEDAITAAYWNRRCVVLEVCVRPQDWIATSRPSDGWNRRLTATYRRVFVSERQPYLEWY